MKELWWKEAIVYQIYPRSFNDSNNDGIGDLRGVINKVDYLKSLGIDIVWLNPVYKSPNDDMGYDISDYKGIMDEFGTMEDMDELLEKLHKNGIKLIMDLVINHTSDEHEWFVESKKSKDNKYRDYYIWKKGKNGKEPNNWYSIFSGPAWEFDKKTEEYYLHLFSKKQPDLNWENENVKNDIKEMIKWWLDKGIDGFRLDAINLISKDQNFPSVKPADDSGYGYGWAHYMNGPKFVDYMKEVKKECFDKYDIMTVGECAMVPIEKVKDYVEGEDKILDMMFGFDHTLIDLDDSAMRFTKRKWTLMEFKEIFEKYHKEIYNKGWSTMYLANHDFPRMVSKFGNDKEYREESAKMLATFLLTMTGTVFMYQGDEIGMTNVRYDSIKDHRDVEILNHYNEELKKGMNEFEVLEQIRDKNRDNSRTPMQWNDSKNGGFSEVEPWIKVNENYREINVESQEKDASSILNYYRRLVDIRKCNKDLIYGDFKVVDEKSDRLFAYEKIYNGKRHLTVLNFSEVKVDTGYIIEKYLEKELVIGNYHNDSKVFMPYESRVYKIS